MKYLLELDFIDYEKDEVMYETLKNYNLNMSDKKIIRRLHKIRCEKAKELFEKGKYNFEVFEYSIKDYFKNKKKDQAPEEEKKESRLQQLKNSIVFQKIKAGILSKE